MYLKISSSTRMPSCLSHNVLIEVVKPHWFKEQQAINTVMTLNLDYQTNFFHFIIFSIFQFSQNIVYLLDIMLIIMFDRWM